VLLTEILHWWSFQGLRVGCQQSNCSWCQ